MSMEGAQAAEMVPTAGPEEIKLPEVANLSAERCSIIFKLICARNDFVSRLRVLFGRAWSGVLCSIYPLIHPKRVMAS